MPRGTPRALTPEQVREIRLDLRDGRYWAERLGLAISTIQVVRSGKRTYGPLKPDEREAQRRRAQCREWDPPHPLEALVVADTPYLGPLDSQDRQEQLDATYECSRCGWMHHDPVPHPCEVRVERLERFREQAMESPARVEPERVAA